MKIESKASAELHPLHLIGLVLLVWLVVESFSYAQDAFKLSSCSDPNLVEAIGNRRGTDWVYMCSDGNMAVLNRPIKDESK